jgi:histidinol dehydrogenase
VILVPDWDAAIPLANRIAAEHLEIATGDAEALAERIRNAGAIFIGAHTPEVIGDYVGGSNHVLPTARSARFSSGLSVLDYVKRTSVLKLGPEQLQSLGPAAITLARAEGLDAHARSVSIRMNRREGSWTGTA